MKSSDLKLGVENSGVDMSSSLPGQNWHKPNQNARFFFIIEKFLVEEFLVEKFMVEKSRF